MQLPVQIILWVTVQLILSCSLPGLRQCLYRAWRPFGRPSYASSSPSVAELSSPMQQSAICLGSWILPPLLHCSQPALSSSSKDQLQLLAAPSFSPNRPSRSRKALSAFAFLPAAAANTEAHRPRRRRK
jgi:hypothetical protein